MKLVFATNNRNKLKEIQHLLGQHFLLQSLRDIGCVEDIPEPHDTLEENALEKTRFVYRNYQMDCFADDTGLEIAALNGAPGVISARYAGENKDDRANVQKVLEKLEGIPQREARFRTVISLILREKEYLFEGVINGKIIHQCRGDEGFGYDPVFVPEGYDKTFAEMSLAEKNTISHRARAFQKLINFLVKYEGH